MSNQNCQRCGKPLGGIYIGTGTGAMHKPCYAKTFPFKSKETFSQVLTNSDDQVYVRELLLRLVPPTIQGMIVSAFNMNMQRRQRERESESFCYPYEPEESSLQTHS